MQPGSFQWYVATEQEATKKNLQHRKFHTNIRKNFIVRVMVPWNKLPRGVVESPLKIFRTCLDVFLCDPP